MGNQQSIEQARKRYRRRLQIGAWAILGGAAALWALVVWAMFWALSNGVVDFFGRVAKMVTA